ncbi:hypothetical protein NSP_45040 [Nodularia spumigena CCY9414]|nr:hypothetical protein NSP_45040 [Nodularia spumigena CCY9414]
MLCCSHTHYLPKVGMVKPQASTKKNDPKVPYVNATVPAL